MATTQSVIGLLGATLLLARVGFALGPGRRSVRFALLAAAVALVPVGGLPIAGYVRGVTGDLSMTTLVLLCVGFVVRIERRERLAISAIVVSGALLLYPMALGLGRWDPYRLGYSPQALLLGLLALTVVAWVRQFYVLLACLLATVASYTFGLFESSNLWDYLLDPWVAVASIYNLAGFRESTKPEGGIPE